MKRTLATGLATAALLAGGCASGAWKFTDEAPSFDREDLRLPAHQAVEHVTLHVYGREFEFVGYRKSGRDLTRAQLLLESGLSVLDVEIGAAGSRRNSGSVFEAIPNFAEAAIDDLSRTWGSSGPFAFPPVSSYQGVKWSAPAVRRVTDGRRESVAVQRADGRWVAFEPFALYVASLPSRWKTQGPIETTVLGRDLVPEATITYSDFDDDGIPREIHLVDLVRKHTLDIEVEEVTLTGKPAK